MATSSAVDRDSTASVRAPTGSPPLFAEALAGSRPTDSARCSLQLAHSLGHSNAFSHRDARARIDLSQRAHDRFARKSKELPRASARGAVPLNGTVTAR
jgi:hypothetical protein